MTNIELVQKAIDVTIKRHPEYDWRFCQRVKVFFKSPQFIEFQAEWVRPTQTLVVSYSREVLESGIYDRLMESQDV